MSFDFTCEVNGLEKLKQHIEFVKKISSMKNDTKFQDFISDKCFKTLQRVTNERLIGGTTNDELIGEYSKNNKINKDDDGFVLYNDTVIEVDDPNYPNGFSIALAFEYGVGIVGEGTYNSDYFRPWEYNVNNYNFGWYFKKDGETQHTYGYMGFEIFRYTAEEINQNLNKWVEEYYKKIGSDK